MARTATSGRPSTKANLAALVVAHGTGRPDLGATRASGVGSRSRPDVARNTIKAILKDHGIEPVTGARREHARKTFSPLIGTASQRPTFSPWKSLTLRGLVRYVVFFVMKLKTRSVAIAGITRQPDETWMTPVARNLTAAGDGFLHGVRHVILDPIRFTRAPFGACSRQCVTPWSSRVSPNLNAFAERFVESTKSDA